MLPAWIARVRKPYSRSAMRSTVPAGGWAPSASVTVRDGAPARRLSRQRRRRSRGTSGVARYACTPRDAAATARCRRRRVERRSVGSSPDPPECPLSGVPHAAGRERPGGQPVCRDGFAADGAEPVGAVGEPTQGGVDLGEPLLRGLPERAGLRALERDRGAFWV